MSAGEQAAAFLPQHDEGQRGAAVSELLRGAQEKEQSLRHHLTMVGCLALKLLPKEEQHNAHANGALRCLVEALPEFVDAPVLVRCAAMMGIRELHAQFKAADDPLEDAIARRVLNLVHGHDPELYQHALLLFIVCCEPIAQHAGGVDEVLGLAMEALYLYPSDPDILVSHAALLLALLVSARPVMHALTVCSLPPHRSTLLSTASQSSRA